MRIEVKRRTTHGVIIIPLIDILVILLLFYVTTTTFKVKQPSLQIALPKTEQLQGGSDQDARIPITVTAENDIFIGVKFTEQKDLVDALKALKGDKGEPLLELRTDEKADFGVYITILEAIKKAEITQPVPTRVRKTAAASPTP